MTHINIGWYQTTKLEEFCSKPGQRNKMILQGLTSGECTCTCSLASCLLTLIQRQQGFSASCCFLPHTPAGLSDPHWLSQFHKCIQTYTDKQPTDYKYSGQDQRDVQHYVHRGSDTHCAHFNPATKLSVSTLLWEKTCTSAHLMLFI